MGESYELTFSDEDQRLYEKLRTSIQDLLYASAYGAVILKKKWKAKPWSRGSTYLQQSAYITAMVTAYGRAFTESRGWPMLPRGIMGVYTKDQKKVHKRIMTLRNSLYAHSDSAHYYVRPWKSDWHTDVTSDPILEVEHSEIEVLQVMCSRMVSAIHDRMEMIKNAYIKARNAGLTTATA